MGSQVGVGDRLLYMVLIILCVHPVMTPRPPNIWPPLVRVLVEEGEVRRDECM